MENIVIWLAGGAFAIIVWAVRLESRINVSEAKHQDLKELINTKFDNLDKRLEEGLDKRLERIERTLNGYLPRE